MKLAFIASGLRPGGAYDPEGAFSYMKAMVTLHYYNYMNMVRLNLVKWLRGLNHRDHQEYKEKFNMSLKLIPMIFFTSMLSNPKVAYPNRQKSLRSLDSTPSASVLASDRISRTAKYCSSCPRLRAPTSDAL